jgi:lysophospholipase L1-like esterase
MTPAKARSLLPGAGLVLGSVILFLAAAELVLRLQPIPLHRVSPLPETASSLKCVHDSLLGWILPPDTAGSFHTYRSETAVETNAWGIRNPALNTADSASFRILVLGDSYAFGWGVAEAQAFPRRLEAKMRQRYLSRPVDVINAGIPGYGVYQQARMLEYVRAGSRVDLVVSTISLGTDALDDLRVARYLPDRLTEYSGDVLSTDGMLSRLARWSRLVAFVDQRSRGLQFHLANASPQAARELARSLDALVNRCREDGIPLMLVIVPRRSEIATGTPVRRLIGKLSVWQARRAAQRVARSYDVPIIDLRGVLIAAEQRAGCYLTGDVHWTPAAHEAVAEAILGALRSSWLESNDTARRTGRSDPG